MLTRSSNFCPFNKPFYAKWLLKLLPLKGIDTGSLTLIIGDHQHQYLGKKTGVSATLSLNQPIKFLWLFYSQGVLGIAKAYTNRIIETPSLYDLLLLGATNEAAINKTRTGFRWFYQRFLKRHRNNHNSIENSRENISAHYDLGNNFYKLWLDETMSYSSALYTNPQQSLAEAQTAKYQRILDELNPKTGDSILEIGCGWGGFAELAAKQATKISGITLSTEQLAFAQARLKNQGLDTQANLSLTDYRHQKGQFDHLVSIEMFEAVGKEYWNDYFVQLKRLLKKDGKAVLQIITIEDERAESYQNSVDFIQAFIFPGGLLPSRQQIYDLATCHGFKISNELSFGQDYATTLKIWLESFKQHSKALEEAGYDTRFQRIWEYYLDYCRVGFDVKRTDVLQLTLEFDR